MTTTKPFYRRASLIFLLAICVLFFISGNTDSAYQHVYFNANYRYRCHDNGDVCEVIFFAISSFGHKKIDRILA